MRAARGDKPKNEVYGGQSYSAVDSTPEDNGLVHCPHCGRNFSEKAADRHIPHCAEKTKREQIKNGLARKPAPKGRR